MPFYGLRVLWLESRRAAEIEKLVLVQFKLYAPL